MPHAVKTPAGMLSKMAVEENRKHSPERINALMLRLSTSSCPRLETAGNKSTAKCRSTSIQPASQQRTREVARLR